MRYTASTLFALCASPLLALAQSTANPIDPIVSATAGSPLTLKWTPTTSGTVSLILRSGASSDLAAGTYIAQSIQNSGSYTWTPNTMITRGSDYTIEIVDDSDSSETNYTPYFVIDSSNTVAYSTSDISLGAASATSSLSSASNTNTAASTGTVLSGTSTGTAVSSAISSVNSAASSASKSASSELSSLSSAASASGSMSTSASSTGAGFQTTSASSSVSAQSTGAAPRMTAAAGMMGLVALGALAL